jgi:hypothetical protein
VQTLRHHVLRQVGEFLGALAPAGGDAAAAGHADAERVSVSLRESWANVNAEVSASSPHNVTIMIAKGRARCKGDWNREHAHAYHAFAGVYYVRSGFAPGADDSGGHTALQLMDPRAARTKASAARPR